MFWKIDTLEIEKKSLKNACKGTHILVKLQAPYLQLYKRTLQAPYLQLYILAILLRFYQYFKEFHMFQLLVKSHNSKTNHNGYICN